MIARILRLIYTKFLSVFSSKVHFSSRIEYSKITKQTKIHSNATIYHSIIGRHTYIGKRSRIIYAKIGNFCSIGADCAVGMGTHSLSHISTSPIFTSSKNALGEKWSQLDSFVEYKEITIGNDVWIGQRVLIMGGVNIGNGAVVGAGAIVTKDVPPYAIVAGVPAKILRYRFPEEIREHLQQSLWWDMPDKQLKENISLFQSPISEKITEKLFK